MPGAGTSVPVPTVAHSEVGAPPAHSEAVQHLTPTGVRRHQAQGVLRGEQRPSVSPPHICRSGGCIVVELLGF